MHHITSEILDIFHQKSPSLKWMKHNPHVLTKGIWYQKTNKAATTTNNNKKKNDGNNNNNINNNNNNNYSIHNDVNLDSSLLSKVVEPLTGRSALLAAVEFVSCFYSLKIPHCEMIVFTDTCLSPNGYSCFT